MVARRGNVVVVRQGTKAVWLSATTGRRLTEDGMPANAGSVIVMLDGKCAFQALADKDLVIHWGAYLGTPDAA